MDGERYLRLVVTAPDTGDETLRELLATLRGGPGHSSLSSLAPVGADDGLETIFCSSADEWEAWLEEHHARVGGVWIKMAKKASGVPSVNHPEALERALCFGWIDGRRERLDETYFLQRFRRAGRAATGRRSTATRSSS